MIKNKRQFKKGHIPWNKGNDWLKEKVCKKCGKLKPRSDFIGKQKLGRPYHLCMECRAKHSKEWREKYPERYREAKRKHNLKRIYGITIQEYDKILKKQKGRCAICGKKPGKIRLAVDHCHRTGKIRGLLCNSCNLGIGKLGDTIEKLKKAIDYLRS